MRRAIGLATACAALAGAVWGPACYDRTCDPGPIGLYGVNPGEGELTSEDTWESTPFDADWISYSALSGWNIVVGRWITENRPMVEMHAYISEEKHPASTGNFTESSGNSSEFSRSAPGHIWVYNATCANFYVRFVLRGGRPLVDAGPLFPSDDAATDDAATDAATDAPHASAADAGKE